MIQVHALPNKSLNTVGNVLIYFASWTERQYRLPVAVFRQDNEGAVISSASKTRFQTWALEQGIVLECAPPYTHEPNGSAERSNQTITNKSIAMLKEANLPEELSPESTKAAAYLYNMSPKQRLAWRTPKSVINEWHLDTYGYGITERPDPTPDWSGIYVYGCRAYPLQREREANTNRRFYKTHPRGHIGYLVGYQASNIYRIWIPVLEKVISTRNVTFNEHTFYDPLTEESEALQARTLDDIAKDIEISEQTSAIDQLTQIVSLAFPEENETIALPFNPTSVDILRAGRETSEPPSPTVSFEDSDSESDTPAPNIGLLTPEATPPPDEDNHASIHTPSDSDAQHMSTNDPPLQGTERHSNTEEQGTDSTSSSSIVPQGYETLTEHTFSGHTF